jgi:PAS domain S-box-containing protein
VTNKLRILHLEDMPTDAELVGMELTRSKLPFERLVVDNKIDYLHALENYNPDVILSDHSLPSFDSIEAFELLKQSGLNVPFILITATISEEFAVEIMKNGAADYILKDRMQRLPNAILNALEKFGIEAERKKYLADVIARESLLKEAEDIAHIGSLEADMKTDQVKWSPGLYKILGLDINQIEPSFKNLFNRVHPDDVERVKSEIDNAISDADSVSLNFRIKTYSDDKVKYLHAKLLVARDEKGAPMRLTGFAQDVSEQKLAEQQIQEASETQAAILNALPPNIVLINEKGKIIAVNESWKKLALFNNLGIPNYGLGYSYLAISETATAIDKATSSKIEQGINDIINGSRKEFEMEYASLSGKDWFLIVVAPLADHTQKGAVILHINITDRKLAEASLQKSEANLRSVFEHIDLAIMLFDTDLNVVSYNSNASTAMMKHFNKGLKIGKPVINYFPKDRRQSIKKAIALAKDHQVAAYETNFPVPDGEREWYDIKWVGVFNEEDELVGIILTFKNITEKKNIESERENMTADLAQRNKDLEQFTYIISHNLRAPVANIQGLASLLGDFEPGAPESADTLEALSVSVNNLDKVILDLNQILQVRSQVNDQIELVSLPLLLQEIGAGISQMVAKNNVTIKGDFTAIDELYILKSYLYSIFQNLVINSIKYRRTDVDSVIAVSTRLKNDKLLICFKDNGRGIDLEKYGSHLFGLYKRFDWSVEGKGVGLFMVKMQVESLGGSITVKSKVNEGAEFILKFPLSVKWRSAV